LDSKIKNRGHPISATDYAISLCADLSYPLLITYQLFWFADEISRFLRKRVFYRTRNGIIIGPQKDFKYERVRMERSTTTYLFGFDSNFTKECYNTLIINCFSEEEKLATHKQVLEALHELVDSAYHNKIGSAYMMWPI
jgi:hypothetical protein